MPLPPQMLVDTGWSVVEPFRHKTGADAPTTDEGDEPAELPPIRAHNPPPPGKGDKRIAAVLAHMAAHPGATDVSIEGATGVARSTVGRWRRRGLLNPPTVPTIERNGAAPAHAREA